MRALLASALSRQICNGSAQIEETALKQQLSSLFFGLRLRLAIVLAKLTRDLTARVAVVLLPASSFSFVHLDRKEAPIDRTLDRGHKVRRRRVDRFLTLAAMSSHAIEYAVRVAAVETSRMQRDEDEVVTTIESTRARTLDLDGFSGDRNVNVDDRSRRHVVTSKTAAAVPSLSAVDSLS